MWNAASITYGCYQISEFGFGLESDNVKTEAVERKANTIMDQTKRPEVKGNPAYLLFF